MLSLHTDCESAWNLADTQSDTQGNDLDVWIEEQIKRNSQVSTEELAKLSGKGVATIKTIFVAKLQLNFNGIQTLRRLYQGGECL